jgi:hypothetical protein
VPEPGAKTNMETAHSAMNVIAVDRRCSGIGSLCVHQASGVGSDCDCDKIR